VKLVVGGFGCVIHRMFYGNENLGAEGYPVSYMWCLGIWYRLPYHMGRWANWRCERNFYFGRQRQDRTLPEHWAYVYGMRLWQMRFQNPLYQVRMNLH
jgi:hypothetical protein